MRRGAKLALCAAAGLLVGVVLVFGFGLRPEFVAVGLGAGVAIGGVLEGRSGGRRGPDPEENGRRGGGRCD